MTPALQPATNGPRWINNNIGANSFLEAAVNPARVTSLRRPLLIRSPHAIRRLCPIKALSPPLHNSTRSRPPPIEVTPWNLKMGHKVFSSNYRLPSQSASPPSLQRWWERRCLARSRCCMGRCSAGVLGWIVWLMPPHCEWAIRRLGRRRLGNIRKLSSSL